MKVRYRILTSTTDRSEVHRVYMQNERDADLAGISDIFSSGEKRHSVLGPRRSNQGLLAPAVAYAEAPRKVLASDGEAELEEVKKMLLEGRMASTDLVDLGQGWQSVIDCYPLEEEALVAARRERRKSAVKSALQITAALLGFALFLYLFLFSGIE
jgi:hypothetical protein